MPEEELFRTRQTMTRSEIAETLILVAEELQTGIVDLEEDGKTHAVTVPENPTFEIEHARETTPDGWETELEFEISWEE